MPELIRRATMPNSAPCGGDAYKPWRDAPWPESRDHRTCDTCAHASREAAEAAMSEATGTDATDTLPGPFGKCLGPTGLDTLREIRR